MKIKIKDFNGIYTNMDENDNRLELVRDSENFYHKQGFLEIDPRNLTEHSNLPDPNADFSAYTWTWETGIYTTLSSDILTTRDIPVPAKHDVLVMIAKAIDNQNVYHRLVYLYDITNSEGWYEMSKNGNYIQFGGYPIIDLLNHDGTSFDGSFMSTTIDGEVHFQVEDGRLKLYFPHDTFWLGKLDRKLWIPDKYRQRWDTGENYRFMDYEQDYWYIDRITDTWNYSEQLVHYLGFNRVQHYTVLAQIDDLECAKESEWGGLENDVKRRFGILYDLDINIDQTHTVGGVDVDMGRPYDEQLKIISEIGNYRAIKYAITDSDTGLPLLDPQGTFSSEPGVWARHIDADRTDQSMHGVGGNLLISDYDEDDIYLYFMLRHEDDWRINNGDGTYSSISTVASWQSKSTGHFWRENGEKVFTAGLVGSMSMTDFYATQFQWSGDGTIADVGFSSTKGKFAIVATVVIDEREEIPVAAETYSIAPGAAYAIRINSIQLPSDIDKRVTRLRFYHQLKDEADLDMVKEFNFLQAEDSIQTFEFTAESYSGNMLAANIGFLWDLYEHPKDLTYINGFKDFVTENGISVGISSRDKVAIYHSTYGGGNLMPNLIYDDNRLAITGVTALTAVANADGRLMVFSDNTAYLIHAQEISGIIGFRFEDTIEVGVKDKNDVANIQGGVCVHTQHGIYITNGYQTQLVSAPIDNLVVQYYTTGRIYYNKYKHEIYYKPTESEDLYRYRMKDAVWERMDKTITEGGIQNEHGIEAD